MSRWIEKKENPVLPIYFAGIIWLICGLILPIYKLWALALTAALVLGKCAGGFLADKIGAVRASNVSLALAAGLYLLSGLPLPGTLAVFLFNMTMPITLWAVARAMPAARGFTFGLLTFALFLGFLPSWLGWPSLLTGPVAYAAVALASLLLLWRGLKGVERC